MSINPGGMNYGWNYSKPDKPGYSTSLVGTVLSIQEVQKQAFTMTGQPGAPEFWPDGNPKMNIRLVLVTEDGNLRTFVFQPAGKDARAGKKRSVHMDLFHLTGDTDMMNLVGKTICIQTQEGHYGQGNPRPWFVSLVDEVGPFQPSVSVPAELTVPQVLANSAVSGGQMNAPQQQQPQQYGGYQAPPQQQYPMHNRQGYQPQQQNMYPTQQQQYPVKQYQPYQPQPQPQPQPQQQQQWQPQQQYQPQQVQYQQPQIIQQPPAYDPVPVEAYPEGMDQTIADAMQVFGSGTQVEMIPSQQPTSPVGNGDVYEDEMPF